MPVAEVKNSVLILGAGMSGLVAGYEFSKKGYSVRIVERLKVPGGLARTLRFEDYYVDSGPHLYHTSNADIVAYWNELFPGVFRTPSFYAKNYIDGNLFDYPLTFETLVQFPKEIQSRIESEFQSRDSKKLTE